MKKKEIENEKKEIEIGKNIGVIEKDYKNRNIKRKGKQNRKGRQYTERRT